MRSRLLLLAALLPAGCSVLKTHYDEPIDPARIAAIQPGTTHRSEVLAALGPPSELARHGEGLAFLYERMTVEEKQLGISLKLFENLIQGTSLFKVALGRGRTQRESLLLYFDARGTLRAVGSGNWKEIPGKGGSLQIFVTVNEVVDTEAYEQPPRSVLWGLELLEPLPETLNQANRAQFELRGTPAGSGQRALELPD